MYSWQQKRRCEGRRRQRRRSKIGWDTLVYAASSLFGHPSQYIAIYCVRHHPFLAWFLEPTYYRFLNAIEILICSPITITTCQCRKTDCSLAQCLYLLRNGLR
jgi:hypothetical protein